MRTRTKQEKIVERFKHGIVVQIEPRDPEAFLNPITGELDHIGGGDAEITMPALDGTDGVNIHVEDFESLSRLRGLARTIAGMLEETTK